MSVVTAEQRGAQATMEQRIVAGLQLALTRAGEGQWDEAWEIVEGLWSPFMARERLTCPAFPTYLDEEGGNNHAGSKIQRKYQVQSKWL